MWQQQQEQQHLCHRHHHHHRHQISNNFRWPTFSPSPTVPGAHLPPTPQLMNENPGTDVMMNGSQEYMHGAQRSPLGLTTGELMSPAGLVAGRKRHPTADIHCCPKFGKLKSQSI